MLATNRTVCAQEVSSKAVRVWEHRGNRDLYTGIERTVYDRKGHEMQVDHVLEIQLLNYAWEEGVARNPALPAPMPHRN